MLLFVRPSMSTTPTHLAALLSNVNVCMCVKHARTQNIFFSELLYSNDLFDQSRLILDKKTDEDSHSILLKVSTSQLILVFTHIFLQSSFIASLFIFPSHYRDSEPQNGNLNHFPHLLFMKPLLDTFSFGLPFHCRNFFNLCFRAEKGNLSLNCLLSTTQ